MSTYKKVNVLQKRLAKTLAARYSNAHPDLCWICFDLERKCHHMASRWSELVRKLQGKAEASLLTLLCRFQKRSK
jgi:hypothetical protein